MFFFSKDERNGQVLLRGREGRSYRKIINEFNARCPRRVYLGFSTVEKVVKKFKETDSVMRKLVRDDQMYYTKKKEIVMVKIYATQQKSPPWR